MKLDKEGGKGNRMNSNDAESCNKVMLFGNFDVKKYGMIEAYINTDIKGGFYPSIDECNEISYENENDNENENENNIHDYGDGYKFHTE